MKISLSNVAKLAPGEMIRDAEVKGFGARRQKDAVTYFLQTRVRGRLKWLTIGRHGSPWTPDQARRRAREMLAEIAGGGDPAAEKAKLRDAATVAEAIELFFAEHGPKLAASSLVEYRRLCRLHILPPSAAN